MSTSMSAFYGASLGNSTAAARDEPVSLDINHLLENSDGNTEATAAAIRNTLASMSPQQREQLISRMSDQNLQQLTG